MCFVSGERFCIFWYWNTLNPLSILFPVQQPFVRSCPFLGQCFFFFFCYLQIFLISIFLNVCSPFCFFSPVTSIATDLVTFPFCTLLNVYSKASEANNWKIKGKGEGISYSAWQKLNFEGICILEKCRTSQFLCKPKLLRKVNLQLQSLKCSSCKLLEIKI